MCQKLYFMVQKINIIFGYLETVKTEKDCLEEILDFRI